MSSAYLTGLSLILFYLGYRFYSKYIGYKIYGLDKNHITPAHELKDDIDFIPTNKHILFGHHFTSIAGAAPIIGPCIAVYWGWVPAILWIVLGTIFMGAVHDFANAIAGLFTKYPAAVLPVNIEIIIAIIIGLLIYKKKVKALIPSIIALIVLYLFIWIGSYNPIDLKIIGINNVNNLNP